MLYEGGRERTVAAASGASFAAFALAGCVFTGTALTNGGDSEPHVAWNGAHFGIVYYHSAAATGWPRIDAVKVDRTGAIVASRTWLGSIQHYYVPHHLSGLVWNSDDLQFAFAYTKGKVIHFLRLDANLNPIGAPL